MDRGGRVRAGGKAFAGSTEHGDATRREDVIAQRERRRGHIEEYGAGVVRAHRGLVTR